MQTQYIPIVAMTTLANDDVRQAQTQIQLYVNLEPSVLSSSQTSAKMNFDTYFDHLLRASEIPMMQFLEQLYGEAKVRAEGNSKAEPREFQTLLREFVRKRPESRVQLFLEHMRGGKHSFEHLGTMALIAVRTLTQSLVAGDHELVTLAQTRSDSARFHVQTGLTFDDLFVDAICEAARQLDRNPTYLSRQVRSQKYLENRAAIRKQIKDSLRASLNDTAIKAFSSLRQHIAERTMQLVNSEQAMLRSRNDEVALKPRIADFDNSLMQEQTQNIKTQSYALQPNEESAKMPMASTGPREAVALSQSTTSPNPFFMSTNKGVGAHNFATFDERVSTMSSGEALAAQNDVNNSFLKLTSMQREQQEAKETENRATSQKLAPPTASKTKQKVHLEGDAAIKSTTRVSASAVRKQHDIDMADYKSARLPLAAAVPDLENKAASRRMSRSAPALKEPVSMAHHTNDTKAATMPQKWEASTGNESAILDADVSAERDIVKSGDLLTEPAASRSRY